MPCCTGAPFGECVLRPPLREHCPCQGNSRQAAWVRAVRPFQAVTPSPDLLTAHLAHLSCEARWVGSGRGAGTTARPTELSPAPPMVGNTGKSSIPRDVDESLVGWEGGFESGS